ncbi:MAG TPA: PQQ-binding-like beta-propeller repeat protein, partial [Caulobacteraceae bacterium]|nr:PQQ-binding-like beta-propeller repeat protein [Caulobacteraceae bacterium]
NAPCAPPPWGTLNAIDLKTGKLRWTSTLGSLRELGGPDDAPLGSVVLGGPIVTAGGLVFSGGTLDRRLHAFDVKTGKELWTAELPASAHALPMTYEAGGRQYLVIASGGAAKIDEERQSDSLVAFALPTAP